jgi:hypothetical protein
MNRTWIKSRTARCLLLTTILGGSAAALHSQMFGRQQSPRASQHGSVSQQIADTLVTIEYNRPVARGRELFGGVVSWGRIWNPGANEATSIKLSTDVKINGQTLAAGTYTMWADVEPKDWTIIFSRATNVWHIPYPPGRDVLRVQTTPRSGSHMETLTFYFPVVDGKKAELVLHWGTMVVPLELEVP